MEFRIILKKLHNKLSSAEEAEFQDWLHSSKDHKAYFERARNNYNSNPPVKVDKQKAWKVVSKATYLPKRRRLKIYAAAGMILIFGLSLPFFKGINNTEENRIVSEEKTISEDKGVVFTDQSGEKVVLTNNKKVDGSYYTAMGQKLKLADSAVKKKGENSIHVPRGSQFTLELSDGTIVYLNSDTKLTFPSSFKNSNRREVHLISGEAYFDVTPSKENNNKSFVVVNEGQKVEVIGTEFNIKAYEGDDDIATTLISGKVSLITKNQKVFLAPGEQSLLNRNDKEVEISKVDVSEYVAWRDGVFYFNNKTLGDIMLVLSRWYDLEIIFKDPEMKELQFNGVFTKQQKIKEILEIIESSNKIQFEINGNKIEVSEHNE